MLRFLKELKEAVREGVDEAHAELADEKREESIGDTAFLDGTTPEEHFATALGAPYRDIHIGAMRRRDADDPAVFLQVFALPEKERASYAKLLARDFDVVDADSARERIAFFLEELDGGTDPETGEPKGTAYRRIHDFLREADAFDVEPDTLRDTGGFERKKIAEVQDLERRLGLGPHGGDAFRLGVLSHIVGGACGVGFLTREDALELAAPVGARARALYAGWPDYAAAYLAGERCWGGSNVVARKIIDRTVANLLEHAASPWRSIAWADDDSTR